MKFNTARCVGVAEYLWGVKRREKCIILAARTFERREREKERKREREAGREGSERVGVSDLVII